MLNTATKTVLVIDDDVIVRESIIAYLEDSGYQVLAADNGHQGLAVFREKHPDLVLCDLRMPQLDGLSVLQEVAQVSPLTPFIVISGAGVMNDVVQALRLGASDYLIKPVADLEVLEHSIRRNLERCHLQRENISYRNQLEGANNQLEKANKELRNHLDLLETDLKAARQVQRRLLPAERSFLSPLQFAHKILPSLYLSGDFVDYFAVTDTTVVSYIADVSGHGASSAFVTVLLKHLMQKLKHEFDDGLNGDILCPEKVLARINDELLESGLGKHATLFISVFDFNREVMLYSVAGHHPMPIWRAGDACHYLEGKAFPVGLFPKVSYPRLEIPIQEEFSLTLFSDGVLEIIPLGSLVEKEDALLSAVKNGALTIEQLSEYLRLDSVVEAPDDIAILTIARKGEDDPG